MGRLINYDDRELMLDSLAPRLLNWRAARAKSAVGSAKTNIVVLADSTGVGKTITGEDVGMKTRGWPTRLAALLTTRGGLKAGVQNSFGDFGYGASAPTYDSRVTLGSWAISSAILQCAGQVFAASATTASPLVFTPTTQTDTDEIYFATGGSTGSFNANINGGANTLQATNTGNGVGKLVLTGTLGNNAYNALFASGGNTFILGHSAYNSADKEISIINLSKGGGKAGDLANAFPNLSAQLAVFAPSLLIFHYGINEWLNAVPLATYITNLQAIIAAKPSACDLIMMSPLQSSSTQMAFATQQPYLDAFRDVALASSGIYIDQNARSGGYTAANAAGLMAPDGIHGLSPFYYDEAMALCDVLLSA